MLKVNVIGGGLAGAEATYYLAKRGISVRLYDIKPNKFTPAHSNKNYAELVCSNSLKSNDVYGNAAGLLKEELRMLDETRVQAFSDHSLFTVSLTEACEPITQI